MATTSRSFPRLQVSCLEGRAQSTRFKQAQFHSLHETLKKSSDAIKASIAADSGHTPREVDFEFSLALSELRLHYDSLNLVTELANSLKIESGLENVDRVRPVGMVYILPQKQNLFYSVISPLGAAVAAGNCVVLELPQTLMQVASTLRKILPSALDIDTFAISEIRPPPDFMNQCLVVIQADEEKLPPPGSAKVLKSPSSLRTVAVIDRTSNVEEAAGAIASSKLSFSGRSTYSPDLVLVNEFVADQFLSALVKFVAGPMTRAGPSKARHSNALGEAEKLVKDIEKKEAGRVIVAGINGSIIEVHDGESALLNQKLEVPVILVQRISSLDNAIDLCNGPDRLSATFIFAAPSEASYLSNFINADLSCVNHIPAELMVGPISPATHTITPGGTPRYRASMFSSPSPQLLHPTPLTTLFSSNHALQKASLDQWKKWQADAIAPLAPTGQSDGKMIGFFDQALFVGLGTMILGLVGAGASGWLWIRRGSL